MNLSQPFIERPVATSLLMVGVLFAGIVAYPMLPVAPLPQVDFPTIQVAASLPGANPETMASAVATPLERQFAQIAGVNEMTSTSGLGTTSITLQFDLDRNIDAAAQDVQAAINAAGGQLPKDLPNPPTYRKVNPADSPVLILAVQSDSLPLTAVDDAADAIVFVLEHYSAAEPINVGIGVDVSIRELAELIAKVVGYRGELAFDASKPDGAPRRLLDNARLAALGWRARTPLAEGLDAMYRWYCKHKVDVAA